MREFVKKANALTLDDLNWKPLYPNNMPCNGLNGYYCLILHTDSKGITYGRKYTIEFQYKETDLGTGITNRKDIDRYILFEKSYSEIHGSCEHPEPSNDFNLWEDGINTLNAAEVNDYGRFVYAYKDLEFAKKRALTQYKAVYGYAMSYII